MFVGRKNQAKRDQIILHHYHCVETFIYSQNLFVFKSMITLIIIFATFFFLFCNLCYIYPLFLLFRSSPLFFAVSSFLWSPFVHLLLFSFLLLCIFSPLLTWNGSRGRNARQNSLVPFTSSFSVSPSFSFHLFKFSRLLDHPL